MTANQENKITVKRHNDQLKDRVRLLVKCPDKPGIVTVLRRTVRHPDQVQRTAPTLIFQKRKMKLI